MNKSMISRQSSVSVKALKGKTGHKKSSLTGKRSPARSKKRKFLSIPSFDDPLFDTEITMQAEFSPDEYHLLKTSAQIPQTTEKIEKKQSQNSEQYRRTGHKKHQSGKTSSSPGTPGLSAVREKVSRRRQIDPTTCERNYTSDEIEFMNALDSYKRNSGRMFPTCSEILEVVRSLGYTKTAKQAEQTQNAREPDKMEVSARQSCSSSTPTFLSDTNNDIYFKNSDPVYNTSRYDNTEILSSDEYNEPLMIF